LTSAETSGPIREAFIETAPADSSARVGGLPLLLRTILSLQRAGIDHCTLVGPAEPPADPRIRCRVSRLPALLPSSDEALRIVVGPGSVIDTALVLDLQRRARPGELLDLEEAGARVRVAPGPLVAAAAAPAGPPAAGTLASATAPRAIVERALLGGLENPHDGWFDRILHRRLSRPLTRFLLRTPLSPNAVTLMGITIGVAGGLLLGAAGRTGVALGVACLIVSGVLDCSDGELARLRFAESRLGHWLDMAGDTVVHLAVLAGITLYLGRTGDAPGWPVLALLGVGVLGAFAAISSSEVTEDGRHRIATWENRVLDGILAPLSTRDWHVFVVAFALAGRLDLLVPAAAVGAQVFWITTAVLLLRVLRRPPRP
jgi:phosphatidylglycerophosphate synthase